MEMTNKRVADIDSRAVNEKFGTANLGDFKVLPL